MMNNCIKIGQKIQVGKFTRKKCQTSQKNFSLTIRDINHAIWDHVLPVELCKNFKRLMVLGAG